jgi:flagellar hook-basal body complex protein FliE
MEINGISASHFGRFLEEKGENSIKGKDFVNILEEFITWVDSQQKASKEIKEAVLRGEDVPLHRMVIEFEKAGVALNLLIEIRNRLLEGFQELMRMQV